MIAALYFFICAAAGPVSYDDCDDGVVYAQSCAIGEAWMRRGLRHGQVLVVLSCEVRP
jgi:hypothetical protein